MSCLRLSGRFALTSLVMALCNATAQAAVMTHIGAQAPKADLSLAAPPVLVGAAASALDAFTREVDSLGGNEFEPGPVIPPSPTPVPASLDFTYAGAGGASATFSGNAAIKPGAGSNVLLGRYNMSPAVAPAGNGGPGRGTWVEASANFEVNFSQAISAFSFFTTDLGDYDGHFVLDLLDAGGNVVFSRELENRVSGGQLGGSSPVRATGNGNLLYVGITSTDPTQTFSRAVFRISQCVVPGPNDPPNGCDGTTDVLGFDSFVVGNYRAPPGGTPVPEPTSLALVGLALCAAGWARKGQRAA